MESLIKKSFLSLIIMLLIALTIPSMVNAADESAFKMSDMKLNKIIYFEGQTYSPINYSCMDKYAKESYDERTYGLVWKLNKKYDSIVIQLSNGFFRTIKVEDVMEIREEDFIRFDGSSTIEDALKGDLRLNIVIDGEKNKVELSNKALVNLDTNGALTLTGKSGESKVTVTKKGEEDKPVEFYIIRDAEGKVLLDITKGIISAEAKAEILQAAKTGADAKVAVEDGVLVLAANAKVTDRNEEQTIVGAGAELSYDTKQDINADDTDIEADVHAEVLGHKVVEKENVNTRIIKTIKTILGKLSALRRK